MKSRKDQNMEIIRLLVNYINSNPDQRFGQILYNLSVITPNYENIPPAFYEEPEEMIKRIIRTMQNKGDENV